MAIGTDDAIEKFGTQTDVDDGSTSAIADGAISVSADITAWTNSDDAPMAYMVFDGSFAAAPDLNSTIDIIGRRINVVDTTDDEEAPVADFPSTYLGSFVCNNGSTSQVLGAEIALPNAKSSQEWEFYFINNSGQQISAGWSASITPKTIGPHA